MGITWQSPIKVFLENMQTHIGECLGFTNDNRGMYGTFRLEQSIKESQFAKCIIGDGYNLVGVLISIDPESDSFPIKDNLKTDFY